MSNDLISRKALIENFWEYTNNGKQRYLIPEDIWEMVELMPTAYNVDKVVEQLSDERFTIEQFEYDSFDVVDFEDAIEIVKAGGIGD